MKRNLHADLALCEAATPGPWWFDRYDADDVGSIEYLNCTRAVMDFGTVGDFPEDTLAGHPPSEEDLAFIIGAREGWPEAIRRAIEAEAEVERLHAFIEHESEVAIGEFMEFERVKAENARNVGTIYELSGALAGIIGLIDHGRLHSTKMSIGVDNAIYKAREALRNATQ
ncbi:hypothetical protein M3231_15415 [Neobacillus mesonae]|nr:hypothetical protein [Neobacillus mesonae]